MQMNLLLSDDVRKLYYPCNVKKPRTTAKLSIKSAETGVVLIVFDGVVCKVHPFTVTVTVSCR